MLELWLKADDGLSTDGKVWRDKSGHGRDALALPNHAPKVIRSGIGGLRTARFTGNQALIVVNSAAMLKQDWTIFSVVRHPGSNNEGYRIVLGNTTRETVTTATFFGTVGLRNPCFVPPVCWVRLLVTDSVGGSPAGNIGGSSVWFNSGKGMILGAMRNQRFLYTPEYTQAVNTRTRTTRMHQSLGGTNTGAGPFYIGRNGESDNAGYWDGDIAEILVFSGVLTSAETDSVQAYLVRKWKLDTTCPNTVFVNCGV